MRTEHIGQSSQDSPVKNSSPCFGEMSDAPAPIICTAKCSASALKDIFGEYNNCHYFAIVYCIELVK